MRSKKYNEGDQLIVTKGPLSGAVGDCVGYGDKDLVKICLRLGDEDEYLAVVTIPAKSVSLLPEMV